ncbi:DUF6680 family protein [Bauldia litoralis]|uniref:DUF6680 family protein n=1 Tax=Bauldia litoralis TaxID=665467 RepID=UPI0032672A48
MRNADWALVAAFLSAIATGFAAWAAILGPRIAAKIANNLKAEYDATEEKRKLKLQVFATIMSYRGATYSTEAVKSFNLIDIVFADARPVRDNWAKYLDSLDERNAVPSHEKNSRLLDLLRTMAEDLGLGEKFRMDDFQRLYYPKAQEQEDQIRAMQHEALLRTLETTQSSPGANTTPDFAQSGDAGSDRR